MAELSPHWNFLFGFENSAIVHPSRLISTLRKRFFCRSTPAVTHPPPAWPEWHHLALYGFFGNLGPLLPRELVDLDQAARLP